MATLALATAWIEAPVLGNHWLLALVNLGLLLALAVGVRGDALDAPQLAARFLPVARWSLLGFYVFAAFAKLNHAFLDPKVNCSARCTSAQLTRRPPRRRLVPVLAIAVELVILAFWGYGAPGRLGWWSASPTTASSV